MVIENREAVVAGVKLVATYKKQAYVCTVESDAEGKLAFMYDGKPYKSPSSAGTAVIGTACNGWRFWSIEGVAPATGQAKTTGSRAKAPAEPATKARTTRAKKGVKVFYRSPNQQGLEAGQTRYYCNACMAGFVADQASFAGMAVDACPNGHSNEDPELTSAPAAAAVAVDLTEETTE